MNDTAPPPGAYHDGMRCLQDRFDTRRLADRLDEKLTRRQLSAEDRTFISGCMMFFFATADAHGRPDCSYRGGAPGFVRVTDVDELAFPSYDGDGKFRSLGNALVNPAVALLFIDFEKTQRLRVLGTAHIQFDDSLLAEFAGAKLVVRVRAGAIFPNCPRYIHSMKLVRLRPICRAPASPHWCRRGSAMKRSAMYCRATIRPAGRRRGPSVNPTEETMPHAHTIAHNEKAEWKNFARPDEVREFPKGRLELINVGGAMIGRAIFDPGWRWATSVQPLAKTRSCEASHFQYHVSGVLRILMDDGTEFDCKPGDVSLLPSGHDAWVVGDEPAVVVDFQGMIDYAKAR